MAFTPYEMMAEEVMLAQQDTLPPEVWLLGRQFDLSKGFQETKELQKCIAARLWFTYRRGFEPIGDSSLQFDSGWGCMLRCGQMLLAEALVRCRFPEAAAAGTLRDDDRRDTLRLFEDKADAPYSIHNIASRGTVVKKAVGDWFGPNAMAQVLKSLTTDQGEECDITVHVAMDSTICLEDIDALHENGWKPLLLLIPLRLGLNGFQKQYTEPYKKVFSFPETIGAMGGKPNSAYYFIGTQGDETIFLDPHRTQLTVNMSDDFPTESFSCKEPQWMPIVNMDPSVCVAFFCRTREDFDNFLKRIENVGDLKLVSVMDARPDLDMLGAGDDLVLSDDDGFELL